MSSGMPELGSKISLISKADIRYEGRLFTVDPQECTIALASVRSFGTEDRETQYPVAPQSQVYDYILFRGSDIKDIRVLNNVPSLPNDPAIVQMSVPPSLGTGGQGQYTGQYNHPVVGQTQYPQYHPMAGFPGSVHPQLSKTSELSPQTSVDLTPQPQPVNAPIGSGVVHHNQVKDQGSMLDLIGGGSQQSASRSGTPAAVGHRKSPTADQGTQAGSGASGSGQRDSRRTSTGGGPSTKPTGQRPRPLSRTRQRQPSGSQPPQMHNHQPGEHVEMQNYNRGGWRGRSRGRGRGFVPRNKNTLKFDNDYDFEQANTEFEELRSQLAKAKISDADVKVEVRDLEDLKEKMGEVDKKDDSGNETGAGEPELEEDNLAFTGYDKKKSFFDNISCEAVERSKGRSQRTDWRTERKLNSETFGVASARRGAWRPRATWRHPPHNPHPHPHAHPHAHPHHPMSYFPSWRPMRGGRGRLNHNNSGNMNNNHHNQHNQHNQQRRNNAPAASASAQPSSQQASAAAK
ncbi:protein LSM14 homolog B isoform X2 [Vanessa cardui]|uniref:protein LSM14 homolog B isoform X2 n=1 Tax=Vanessa cardui TaxID=171605 RepID=UPI001F129889|nr:protein LSM14 homolog B isoform X2 [Vanessa cardui]